MQIGQVIQSLVTSLYTSTCPAEVNKVERGFQELLYFCESDQGMLFIVRTDHVIPMATFTYFFFKDKY